MATGGSNRLRSVKADLGAEIRRLRKDAGLTQEALGRRIGYSRVSVTNVETGRDIPGADFVRLVGAELGASESINQLFAAVLAAHQVVRSQERVLSGLPELSDVDDAGVVLIRARNLDGELVLVNINRREALRRLGAAAVVTAFSPGSGLLGKAIMVSPQLATPIEHLRAMYESLVDSDNLFGSAHALRGTQEQLDIIERIIGDTRSGDRHALVYLRARFAESMAWLTQDQADYDTAWQWTDRALEWSHLAADPALTAIVLTRKSQLAADRGDGATALDYALATLHTAPESTRLPAVAHLCAAHGHALNHDYDQSARAYDAARDLVAGIDLDPEHNWGAWLDHAYIDAQQARSLSVVGRHHQAVDTFIRAIDTIPENYPRERGVHLARAATACSRAGEPQQAATLAVEALQTGLAMRSGRIDHELRLLLEDLQPIEGGAVSEFREFAHAVNLI